MVTIGKPKKVNSFTFDHLSELDTNGIDENDQFCLKMANYRQFFSAFCFWSYTKSNKATTMRSLVSHYQSLVQARWRAVIIIIHYCGFSGSSANSNSPSLGRNNVRKNSRVVIVSKWHSKVSHSRNSFPTPSYTSFYITGIPYISWWLEQKNNTTLERQPDGDNEVNDRFE